MPTVNDPIALSTTEAEYVAIMHAFQEGIWLRSLQSTLSHLPLFHSI